MNAAGSSTRKDLVGWGLLTAIELDTDGEVSAGEVLVSCSLSSRVGGRGWVGGGRGDLLGNSSLMSTLPWESNPGRYGVSTEQTRPEYHWTSVVVLVGIRSAKKNEKNEGVRGERNKNEGRGDVWIKSGCCGGAVWNNGGVVSWRQKWLQRPRKVRELFKRGRAYWR